jgi:DNA-binding transcriptional LysR family regulator
MAEFTKKHPMANITLRTQSSVEIEKLLLGSKVDVAITTNPSSNLLGSSFVAEAYCREPLIAFVAADHPLARLKTLSLADLITFPVF